MAKWSIAEVRSQIAEVKAPGAGSLALTGADREVDEASEKHDWGGPSGDVESALRLHPEFGMRRKQAPGQGVSCQSTANAKSKAENEITLEGHLVRRVCDCR